MALADYELVLPYAEWRGLDWPGQIRNATGLAKRILQMQERAVHAIAGLAPGPTTPERLAWSVLWVRGFLLLQAAGDLHGEWSVRVADPLYRLAFELWLQVSAIRHPWARLNELSQSGSRSVSISEARLDREWETVADRLCGFAAWALTNDLVYYRYRLRTSELNSIHTATDPATIPADPGERAMREYLFGNQDIISEAEASRDKAAARRKYDVIVHRLLDWLSDPVFGHWTKVSLAPWIDGQQTDVPSLYRVFDPDSKSVRDMLSDMGADYLYGAYARGSLLLHGSSIEQFTATSAAQKKIVPVVLRVDEEEDEHLCANLAEMCNDALLALWGMRDHCVSPSGS